MNSLDKYDELQRLSEGDYEAFLYDCDGTLADNMQAHKDTYVQIAMQQQVHIDVAMIDELAGFPIPAVVVEINKRYNSQFDPVEFDRLKSALFYNEYIDRIKPVDFVVNHLKASAGKYKIGVVSGGSTKMIKKTLEVLGIAHLVDALVCAEDTVNGKPSPEPFLLAAKKLGVEPIKCLVFEDGNPGIKSADSAGMRWIRIDKI